MTNTTNIRANKITVKAVDTGYQADFYRTHKHIATILSADTEWQAPEGANKSAQREDFRQYVIDHASDWQVEYDPEDRRDARNTRIPTYSSDDILGMDASRMLENDLQDLIPSIPYGVQLSKVEMESAAPKTTTGKGTNLSLLGITDGKYLNGNWAWADLDMVASLTVAVDDNTYPMDLLFHMELVSGQLKKTKITKTNLTERIKEELLAVGAIKPEEPKEKKAKAEKSAKADTPTSDETTSEEPKQESKPKRTRKSSKKNTTSDAVEG